MALNKTRNSTTDITADDVGFTPAGIGAVATNVQTKLRETVSVKDFGALGDGITDDTVAIQAALDSGAASILIPKGEFKHTGLTVPSTTSLVGLGWQSKLTNTAIDGSHSLYITGGGSDVSSTVRNVEQNIRDLWLYGNASSGDGIRLEIIGRTDNGVTDTKPSLGLFDHLKITGHGGAAIQFGESASVGAGNKITISNSDIAYNDYGIKIVGQSNTASIVFCNIHNNTNDGVYLNFVASTNLVQNCQIMDNGGYGVYALSTEQPFITFNGFNRNSSGAVTLTGNGTKSCEAAIIMGNLFGDNGSGAATQREIIATYAKGTNILANYFYGTGQDSMIYVSDYCENLTIKDNHFKDLTTETKLELKVGAVGTNYTFSDWLGNGQLQDIITPSAGSLDLSAVTSDMVYSGLLSANITSITFPPNPYEGQKLAIRFKQGAAAYTVSGWPANVFLAGGAFTLSTAANKNDIIEFVYVTSGDDWFETRRSQNM